MTQGPPTIESYSFGTVTVDGTAYQSDLIIGPDGVTPSWWRKEGHSLHPDDLTAVVSARPDVVIIGCGAHGILTVPDATRTWLEERSIECLALPTGAACDRYNELKATRRVVAGLHLTC